MSKLSIEFVSSTPYEVIQNVFIRVINHWVENHQKRTSSFAKAMMLGVAVDQFKHGSAFAGALALRTQSQGTRHVANTTMRVMIPTSGATMGGEMTITAKPTENGTKFEINGHTQGLFSGTLKENIYGLRDYLISALPEAERQYKEIQHRQNAKNDNTKISITEEIEKLHNLHNKGILTADEYAQAKQKVLRLSS